MGGLGWVLVLASWVGLGPQVDGLGEEKWTVHLWPSCEKTEPIEMPFMVLPGSPSNSNSRCHACSRVTGSPTARGTFGGHTHTTA